MSLGIYVFHEQIARHMMLDTTGGVAAPEFVRRVGVAGLDVYESMGELLLSEQGRQMRRAVDAAFPDTTPPAP
jgi:hypothetical protein